LPHSALIVVTGVGGDVDATGAGVFVVGVAVSVDVGDDVGPDGGVAVGGAGVTVLTRSVHSACTR
jgi:hypothetical protein